MNKELDKVSKSALDPKFASRKEQLLKTVEGYLDSIEAHISPAQIRTSMYVFLKFWTRAFDKVIIKTKELNILSDLIK